MIGIDDDVDKIEALLEQIARNTGTSEELSVDVPPQLRPLDPSRFTIIETADMIDDYDYVQEDGAALVAPGTTAPIVRYKNRDGGLLQAIGANDHPATRYEVVLDDRVSFGSVTQEPLGTPTDPFSFVEKHSGVVPFENKVEYRVHVDEAASSAVEVGGVLHVNDLPPGGQR